MGVLPYLERVARWSLGRRGFASLRVPTPVGQIHVYESSGRGELPPVVVLHGVGSNASPYARILMRLREECRQVVAPETPGHGLSESPTGGLTPDTVFQGIAAALDTVLDEPALVFGNSLGGGIALRYAERSPERVAGLVLSSPAGAPFPDDDALRAFVDNFRLRSRAEAVEFLDHLYGRTPWYARFLAPDILANFESEPLRHFLDAVSPDDFATPDQLAELAMPILMLWGRADTLMPAHHLDFFKAHLPPHAVVEEPAGFGHSPYLEHPDALAERIVTFARAVRAQDSP